MASPLDAPSNWSADCRCVLSGRRGPNMSPGGAGCSAGLLLTVGWLLLAGLRSSGATNVTALQESGFTRDGDGDSDGEGDGDGDSEGENEDDSYNEVSEKEAPTEAGDDGEGGGSLQGALRAPRRAKPARSLCKTRIRHAPVCRALSPTSAPSLPILCILGP